MLVGALACAHDDLSTGVSVHSLDIRGNQSFSDGDLEDVLATKATGWWPFASTKWFDQAAFDLDLKRVTAFYADHGFFDARVVSHTVTPRAGHSDQVDVVVTVQEASPTNIAAVDFVGFPPAEEARARKEAASWSVVPGKRFDYGSYATLKDRLGDRMKEAGYAYGQVTGTVEIDRDKHAATIRLESQPGPLVHLGQFHFDGNGRIPTWKLANRVAFKPGDAYDPGDLATTQGRLYNLGVFSSVRLELPPTPTDVADVAIHLKPGPLHEVRVGAGLGAERIRDEVRARFEYTINNFLGGLRRLRLRLQPAYVVIPSVSSPERSGLAAENDVTLTQPDMFGTRATGTALVGYDLGIAEGYQFHGPRAQLGLERPFVHDRLLVGGSWNLQYLNFFDVDTDVFNGASQQFYGFENPYRLAYLEEFAQLDLRNHPLDPTFGGYLAVHAEEGDPALGGAFHYLKLSPEARVYLPLGHRVVVAGRGLLGWIRSYGGEESPITRRFRLGGPSSHRGFGFGRLAPQARATDGTLIPYGGDGEVLFSGDLRIDAKKIGGNWLDVVPFVDAGDVTPSFDQLDLRHLHVATGLSLEYTTPIGIVRAGAGVRLNRLGPGNPDPGERFAFHITIGEAF
ncbi:MAG TPA: BamA/TamA family outer membrane protein [Polyangia bacterium]|nr:BamA/TamA family outer membrane protein [Polyangia bacterium]